MFEKLLSQLDRALNELDLPYMIIGGQAVLLYGEPRLTRDIDVTVGAGLDRLEDLFSAVDKLGLTPLPEEPQDFVKRTLVLPAHHEESGIRVDFILAFTPYEQQAIVKAKRVPVGGGEVSFASAEDLIIHKIFAGRARDLEDIRSVLVRNKNVDRDYILAWLHIFDESSDENGFVGLFSGILNSE